MVASSPGVSAQRHFAPLQASPPRLKVWYLARRVVAVLAAGLRGESKLTALLLVLTLLSATGPPTLALLLPLLLPPRQLSPLQRSKLPPGNLSKTTAPTEPNALGRNWALAVALGLWLFLRLAVHLATLPVASTSPAVCCGTPERCPAAPCAWTRAQNSPTTCDGAWTPGATVFTYLPTVAELSDPDAYKARPVGHVPCLNSVTMHRGSRLQPGHPRAMPPLPFVRACAEQYARSADTPQMWACPAAEESHACTACLAQLPVLAELSSSDDSKARHTAKTATASLDADDTYLTVHPSSSWITSSALSNYLRCCSGAVPDTAALTGSRLAVIAGAAATGLRRVLGTGAMRQLGA